IRGRTVTGVQTCALPISLEAITRLCENRGHGIPAELQVCVRDISNAGGTPLLVAENGRVLGAIALTDIVKGGMKERFDHLRAMGDRKSVRVGKEWQGREA